MKICLSLEEYPQLSLLWAWIFRLRLQEFHFPSLAQLSRASFGVFGRHLESPGIISGSRRVSKTASETIFDQLFNGLAILFPNQVLEGIGGGIHVAPSSHYSHSHHPAASLLCSGIGYVILLLRVPNCAMVSVLVTFSFLG